MVRTLSLFASICSLVFFCGCDSKPSLYEVAGNVTYKGEPVKAGSINFRADDGSAGGAQIVDGKYSLPLEGGLAAGTYRVAITYPDPSVPPPPEEESPGEISTVVPREMLPKKYNAETTLSVEIPAPDNLAVDFTLE